MNIVELRKIMDLDTAYIEPLIDEWLQHIREDNAEQLKILKEGTEFNIPYMAVPLPVIKTIFVIAGHFGLGPNTKYLTIQLFDKFMCNHFCELYLAKMKANMKDTDNSLWADISKTISGQAKLRLMSCMQLASKMDSHSKGLSISQVMRMLRWLDDKSEYSNNAIYGSEFFVYKTVHFKIPFFTPLHCVEILLAATKLKSHIPEAYDVCVDLLDLAYLQHHQIYSNLQFVMRGKFSESQSELENIMTLKSNLLYLGAAVVLCTFFILSVEESDAKHLLKRLSNLVGIKENDVHQMAELLFNMAVQPENENDC